MTDMKDLETLYDKIKTYRSKLPAKKWFNDQSVLRRDQSALLLTMIDETLIKLQLNCKPADYTIKINEIITSCNATTKIGKSELSVLATKAITCLNKFSNFVPLPVHTYKYVQCIGFYADISAEKKLTKLGEKHSWARTMKYGGDENDIIDIDAKLTRFIKAVNKAETKANQNTDVLKVLMGPEFYLRGAKGAYSIDNAVTILEKLRKVTADPKFAHWIFIPGTAIASLSLDPTESEILNIALVQQGGFTRADGQHEALVYKEYISSIDFLSANTDHNDFYKSKFGGGTNIHFRKAVLDNKIKKLHPTQGSQDSVSKFGLQVRNLCHFVAEMPQDQKEETCTVINEFFLPTIKLTPVNVRTAYDSLEKAIIGKYPMIPDKLDKFLKDIKAKMGLFNPLDIFDTLTDYKILNEECGNLAGGSVFTLAGVRFGIEVCLDHAYNRLRSAVMGTGNIKKIAPVDIQLIPSAGMYINDESVGTKKNGIIFNVDGFRPLKVNTVNAAVAVKTANASGNVFGGAPSTTKVDSKSVDPLTGTDRLVIFAPILLP